MDGWEYGVLGPLRVRCAGADVMVRAGKPRRLLATLLVAPNRVLSTGVLVEVLWGAAPPRSAVANVRTYVRELRATLAREDVIETDLAGYRMVVAADALDSSRLERLADEGARLRRAGDLTAARHALERCRALWRGQPLEDLETSPVWAETAEHLARRYRFAADELVEVLLAADDRAAAVDLLRRRVEEDPYDEDLRTRLVEVLTGWGRRHGARVAYEAACRVLADDLGVRPGAALRSAGAVVTGERPRPPRPTLSDPERTAARVLAGVPGYDIDTPAAAALLSTTPAEAGRLLRALASAAVLTEHRPDRFVMDDVTRAAHGPAGAAPLRRLSRYYASGIAGAAAAIFPELPARRPVGGPAVVFRTDRQAAAWLEAERGNIFATASATLTDRSDLVYAMADALRTLQQVRPHGRGWTALAEAGLRSVAPDEDPGRVGAMHLAVGLASGAGSGVHLSRASVAFRAAGLLRESGYVHLALAALAQLTGHPRAAWHHCGQSLRLRRGEPLGRSSTLVLLADVEVDLGRLPQATRHAVAARTIAGRAGYTAGMIGAVGVLGRIAVERREVRAATEHYTEQFTIADHQEFRCRKASALVGLARCHQLAGHHESAHRAADSAIDAAVESGNRRAHVDALTIQGAAHTRRGRYLDALSCFRAAERIALDAGYLRGRAGAAAALATIAGAGSGEVRGGHDGAGVVADAEAGGGVAEDG